MSMSIHASNPMQLVYTAANKPGAGERNEVSEHDGDRDDKAAAVSKTRTPSADTTLGRHINTYA